ncbi:MAG: bifunctional adenosylcobinamide kinase/adenosylcobinamide-phosphate guanylyltransferase [Myxococcota bacterium]
MGALIFIGGGARSGKSALALERALRFGPRRVFIATAQAFDDEMRDRIVRHQDERGEQFDTLEVPLELPETLRQISSCDVVLIDCLTLWVTNLLMAENEDIQGRMDELLAAIGAVDFPVVLVTNEVGLGIVPMNALARRFRDEVGRAHQKLSNAASEVYFGALGVMLRLKPGPVEMVSRPSAVLPS